MWLGFPHLSLILLVRLLALLVLLGHLVLVGHLRVLTTFVSDVQLRFHFHSYIKLWISEASPGGKKPYLVAPPPQLLFLPR